MLILKTIIFTYLGFSKRRLQNFATLVIGYLGISLGLLLLSPTSLATPQTSILTGMSVSTTNEFSRLIFDLTAPVAYKAFTLTNPDRLIIDINGAKLAARLNHPALLNTSITAIRSNQMEEQQLRLVLDLKERHPFKCQMFKIPGTEDWRLIVDLFNTQQTQIASNENVLNPYTSDVNNYQPRNRPVTSNFPTSNQQTVTNTVSVSSNMVTLHPRPQPKIISTRLSKYHTNIIVIDPGHGGKDSGAIGVAGSQEKNIVLSISKYLQYILNQQPGFRAVLTRDNDYFISLRQRLNIAHKDRADMFIAIHADAYTNKDAIGASVFALSPRGATSELARWVAKQENESELGHVIADKNLLLKSVLIDLAQTLTIDSSVEIGGSILWQLSRVTELHCQRVEQAAFVVLKAPDIPSLLVETGFISNAAEEKRLNDQRYQYKIAIALAQGIKNYFLQHPG